MREPTHPGAVLREDVFPALGVSISAAARELGVTRQTLQETTSITPEMAVRLGKSKETRLSVYGNEASPGRLRG